MSGGGGVVVYISNRCAHCARFMQELGRTPDLAAEVRTSDVAAEPFPQILRQVPAVLDPASGGAVLHQGPDAFAWLAARRKAAIAPFAYGGGGPSPTSVFSFVDSEVPVAHRQDAYSAFRDDDNAGEPPSEQAGAAPQSGGILDALIAQRRSEVPAPIARQ